MYLIVGRKSDHVIVETGGRTDINIYSFKEAIAANYGGLSSDYSVLNLSNNDPMIARISKGDEYLIIWENNEITNLDFSIEDNRKLFMIKTVDPNNKNNIKDTILGDNNDSVIIQTKTCLYNGSLDASINSEVLIPVNTPDNRIVYLKVNIVNGVGTELVFKSLLEGIWSVVPGNINVGNEKMRIVGDNGPNATNTINVLMNI